MNLPCHHNTPEAKDYDKVRTDAISELGINVIRFTNNQVLTDLNSRPLKTRF
jgi:very-short-patch-repair endonuclease